jgi:tetratricopeptide (TPR) repeat protein
MTTREVHLLAGDVDEAERELRWGYETLERMGDKGFRSTIAGNLAEALYRQGRYEEAEEVVRTCFKLASPQDVSSQIGGLTVKAKLLAARGIHDEAERAARDAVALSEDTDDLFTLGQTYMALAEVLLVAHRGAEAVKALEAAAEVSERKGNVVTAEKARSLITNLAASSGNRLETPRT